jgi:hypothetical protein
MRVSGAVVVVVSGLMLAACSAGGSGSGASVGSAAAGLQHPVTASTGPTKKNGVGGIGSSLGDMAYIHGRPQRPTGPCAAPNACFGAPVVNTEDGTTYAFTGVTTFDGLVSGYRQNFVDGTSAVAAVGAVLGFLPADAHASVVTPIYGATTSCAFVNVSSPTVAALFPSQSQQATDGGLSNTVVGVELSGSTSTGFQTYDPADVQVAHVTLGADSSSMPC